LIAVIGEALSTRISTATSSARSRGGPFNTAVALARLGYLGAVLRDRLGRKLRDFIWAMRASEIRAAANALVGGLVRWSSGRSFRLSAYTLDGDHGRADALKHRPLCLGRNLER
jgi:hypothetical protein